MSGPTRVYATDGFVGLVESRRCRATGLEVGLYAAEQAGIESDPEVPWATVCEEHGSVVCHPTLALARSHMARPEWCEECGPALFGEAPSRRN